MPTAWPAKTVLKLIFLRPCQMRPLLVTTITLSWTNKRYRSSHLAQVTWPTLFRHGTNLLRPCTPSD